jgi:hypothetical protein
VARASLEEDLVAEADTRVVEKEAEMGSREVEHKRGRMKLI